MAGGGISGTAVAMAAAGGVLIYAGFQNSDPIKALRSLATGKADELTATQSSWANDPTRIGQGALGLGGGGGVAQAGYGGSGVGAQLVAAAMRHRDEKYSQPRRWQAGYSDCSSFVGKALKDIGITPPGASTTYSYLSWRQLRTVPRSEIQTGDILVSSGHAAIALDGTRAIGQQNGRQNVRIDTITNIMWGQNWVARRYVGSAGTSSAPPKAVAT
jgi:cell wall-associated NlpC family hydrolase